jgi:2-dehydro-3-deoxygluconokinase
MQQGKILSFGEILLRYSPGPDGSWLRNHHIPVYAGGSELNVAAALAKWGLPVKYLTAMPDNELSGDLVGWLREKRIDPSAIHFAGDRLGVYYLQQGKDLKHATVIYDRAGSGFAGLRPGMIDWDKALEGVGWFHFSAISPALNEHLPAVCEEALLAAKARNTRISVDLNHRTKLWQYGKRPVDIMPRLTAHCDVVMGNIWSAHQLLGIPVDEGIHGKQSREAYLQHASQTAMAIREKFPRCRVVANTFRFDGQQGGIHYYASLFMDGKSHHSIQFNAGHIADKIGSGDCFMAGLIYGLVLGLPPGELINYAAAAAFGKMQETGDTTDQEINAVYSLITQYA